MKRPVDHVLAGLMPLFVAACGGSSSGAEAGTADLSGAPPGASATSGAAANGSAEALIAAAISATPKFAPAVPLIIPQNLPVGGLFATVRNENGAGTDAASLDTPGDGWLIEFDSKPNCGDESCQVFQLSGAKANPSQPLGGDVFLAKQIMGTYDPPGCHACGEGVLMWEQRADDVSSYTFSLKALTVKRSQSDLVGFVQSAIGRGPISPAGLLITRAVAATPNFNPSVPVVFPSGLPVGGLVATVHNENGAGTDEKTLDMPGDGWRIEFDAKPSCPDESCQVFQLSGAKGNPSQPVDGDIFLAKQIVGTYDPPGCHACGAGVLTWEEHTDQNATAVFTLKAITVPRTEDQLVALAQDAVGAGFRTVR